MFNASKLRVRAAVRISAARRSLHHLDNALAVLLAESTNAPTARQECISARITYRIMLRHLLKTSLRTHDINLRATLRLKEDILSLGLADFDTIVKKIGSATPPADSAAMLAALQAFNKAGAKANAAISSIGGENQYLGKLLIPLEPLFVKESRAGGAPNVYPVPPHMHRPVTVAVVKPLPPISATLQALQSANISQQMRQALAHVLAGIRTEMANPHDAPAAKAYYRLILRSVRRAGNLNGSRLLTARAGAYLNQQLFLGLLLFKDQRTRRGALHRLMQVGNAAAVLNRLQRTKFPPGDRVTLASVLADALSKLQRRSRRAQGAAELAAIRGFIQIYRAFEAAGRGPVTGATRTAVSALKRTGMKTLATLETSVKEVGYRQGLSGAAQKLGSITANLHRLGAMPMATASAQAYHPQPYSGVTRKILRWAHSIAKHPEGGGSGATAFDHFQRSLAVLDSLQTAVPQNLSAKMQGRLAGGKYPLAVRRFLKLRKTLINDLARRHKSTAAIVAKLQKDRRLFLATQAAAALRLNPGGLAGLNRWAQWQLSSRAVRVFNTAVRKSLLMQYRRAVRSAAGSAVAHRHQKHAARRHERLPVVAFHVVGPAVRKLGHICMVLSPVLTGNPDTWVDSYARALEPAPGDAYFRGALVAAATACLRFNQAALNNRRGSRRIAGPLLIKGFAALEGAPVRAYSARLRP